MTLHSANSPFPIFDDGKLKPWIYKIQNIETENYLDIELQIREVCCRPAVNLEEGRGLWKINALGAGYTLQFVEPGKPEQFCIPMPGKDSPLAVGSYPMPWRVELVDDAKYRGFEYVRFFWGPANWVWTLAGASKANGAKVWPAVHDSPLPRRIWKLIPVKAESASTPLQSYPEMLDSGFLPSYSGDPTGKSSVHATVSDSERDDFGTIATEVTTVTTTTRRRYRVQDS